MAKELKRLVVQELVERYRGIDRCVVVDLTGLSALSAHEVRSELKKQGITLEVVKNSLATRALAEVGLEKLGMLLTGPSAIATGGEDLTALTRIMSEWARKNDKVAIRGGYAEGEVLAREAVLRISRLPGRNELRARLLAQMQSPLTGLLGVMTGVTRNFLGAMSAIRDKQEGK